MNFKVKAHNDMINTLDSMGGIVGEGPVELMTGGRDGEVKVWDPR